MILELIRTSLDNLDSHELKEVLLSVQYQYGLMTEMEAKENIEDGQYTKEEIMEAIAYKRTEGMGSHKKRMNFLPVSLRKVIEDYTGLIN